MAKKKKEENILADVLSITGGKTLKETGQVPWWHDLGNFAANYICSGRFIGGGLPGGKIIEVFGAEATAKSLLGYCFLGGIQRKGGYACLMDMERAGNATFAEKAGHVDSDTLITFEPEHWDELQEKVFSAVTTLRDKGKPDVPIGIMLDSIGVVQTFREWKISQLGPNPTKKDMDDIGAERPGERARAAGDFLRRVTPFLDKNKATLFIINQLRSNISTMKYAPQNVSSGGGRALPYYASTRLYMLAQKEIKEKDTKTPLGGRLTMRNRKSRAFTPGLETQGLKLYFDGGIDPLSGLLTVLIGARRVVPGKGNGNYIVVPEYCDGKEVKFKASVHKERNEINLDLLLQCPALVDAKDEKEVADYVSLWHTAMSKSNSENVQEVDLDSDTEKLQKIIGSDYWSDREDDDS